MNNYWVRLFFSLIVLLIITPPVFAWKPSTHVYLGREALAEVSVNNSEVSFYRVNDDDTAEPELIGSYSTNEALVGMLRDNVGALYMGMVGPDAYPDLPTGQTRIHIPCPDDIGEVENNIRCPGSEGFTVTSSDWLKHVWSEALNENSSDEVRAFAFGYLVHAAGDMFMHTFVNHFAGGPFSSFSDNGLRHFLIEAYVGKRTPTLSSDEYDVLMSDTLQKFIYETLTYAAPGSVLDRELLVDVPVENLSFEEIKSRGIFFMSIPRYFSTLKNNLDAQINAYDFNISTYNAELALIREDIDACVDLAIDFDLLNDCSTAKFINLGKNYGEIELKRDLYFTATTAPMLYAREWSKDIERGLYAWPAFSHEVSRSFIFSPVGMDKLALTEAWEDYKNEHFIKMLGVPDAFANAAAFINNVQDSIYTLETRRWVQDIKLSFVDQLIRIFTLNQHNLNDFENFITNPATYIPVFVNAVPGPIDNDEIPSNAVSVLMLDGYMALNNGVFDKENFAPAYNTINIIKLMLLNREGVLALYQDLKCPLTLTCDLTDITDSDAINETADPMEIPSALLDFIRTLDGDNEWNNHDEQMWFAECDVYHQIFMEQVGEVEAVGNGCEPVEQQLSVPEFSYIANNAEVPIEILLTHDVAGTSIYYTISYADEPYEPSNDPADTRSTLYSNVFTLYAPFTEVRAQIIRAKAYRNGYGESEVTSETFTITSSQSLPLFFPEAETSIGDVEVTLDADNGSTIFYTLNGETPTYLSKRYQSSISLGVGEHTIKAIAYRLGYPKSEVSEKFYRVYAFNDENVLPSPRFSPAGSATVVNNLTVEMFADALNANIYYTISNGTAPPDPTISDSRYIDPLVLGLGNHFIRARLIDPNDETRFSQVRQIRFSIETAVGETDEPVFDPPSGTYFNTISVKASAVTIPENAGNPVIIFTTDGSIPVASTFPPLTPMRKYNNSINIFRTTVLKAQAVQIFFSPSDVVRADYRFEVAKPFADMAAGTYQASVDILLDSETAFPKLYYTLDGTEPTEASTEYIIKDELPITVNESATLKIKGYKNGYFESKTFVTNYIIEELSAPEITSQPVSQSVHEGSNVRFFVAVAANPPAIFQWFKNDNLIEGEARAFLTIQNTSTSDTANYRVEVSNTEGQALSEIAKLEVVALPDVPTITQSPLNQNLAVSEQLLLSVGVEDESAVDSYQWHFNGQVVPSQSQRILTIDNTVLVHGGEYFVNVINRGGISRSETATIIVTDSTIEIPEGYDTGSPKIIAQPENITLNIGEALQLSVAVTATPAADYLWFHQGKALPAQRDALLIIDAADETTAGDYFVLVRNEKGSVVSGKSTITISTVQSSPQVGNNKTEKRGLAAIELEFVFALLLLLFLRINILRKR